MRRLSGPIGPHEVSQTESRAEHTLDSCWERVGSPARSGGTPGVLIPAEEAPDEFPRAQSEEPVLVMLAKQSPASLRDLVARAANQGARVYVVADRAELNEEAASKLASRKGAAVLLRRVAELPISGIVTGRGHLSGLFLSSTPDSQPTWWLPLSETQGSALFRYALHLFWHRATDEGWAINGRVKFQALRERPFDVPLTSPRSPVRPEDGSVRSASSWFAPQGSLPPTGPVEHVFVPPSGENQAALAAHTRKGVSVQWASLGLPFLALDEGCGSAQVGPSSGPVRIELEQAQVRAFRSILEQCRNAPEWCFRVDTRLAELEGDVILPGDDTPSPVAEDVPLSCGSVPATSLRGVADTEPHDRPDPSPLARSVRWTWTVLPPRAPKAAHPDPMVSAWSKVDSDARTRVEGIQTELADLEARTGALGRAFDMAGALLGFGRTRSSLARRAGQLAEAVPSTLGPSGATSHLDQVAALERDVSELVGNVDQAETKARLEKERAEQLAAHEASQQQAQRDLAGHQAELEDQRAAHQAAEKELGALAGDEHGLSKKDRKARQKKLRDDAKRAERRMARLEQLIAEAQAVIETEFTFQPSRPPGSRAASGGGARFVPKQRTETVARAPEEALPAVGELLSHKGARYLMITQWEDLDQGEAEAERLGAQLVAPAEGS